MSTCSLMVLTVLLLPFQWQQIKKTTDNSKYRSKPFSNRLVLKYIYWDTGIHYTEIVSKSLKGKGKARQTILPDLKKNTSLIGKAGAIADDAKCSRKDFVAGMQLAHNLTEDTPTGITVVNQQNVYISNITTKKSTNEALKRSEERYKIMFENIPLPTMVYDLNTLSIVDVNEAAIRHYGYTRNEFLGMTIKDLRPSEDLYILMKYLTKPDPSQERGLWRYKKKDGTIVRVEITSRAIQFPNKNYCIDVVDDVTEEKKVEAALRFTQFAVDHSAVGIIWMGRDGQILYINDEARQSLGYSHEELLTMKIHDINLDYPKETWEKEWHNLKKLGSITIETAYKRKDNTVLPVELTGNFVEYDGNGYICAIYHDITERKKNEEALRKREGELLIESSSLEETNTALKVLLKHREDDKKELEDKFLSNIKSLVFPYIDRLKKAKLDIDQMSCVDIIETNLNDILSPFLQKMSLKYSNFTPTEIQVANLIRLGKTTKEISDIMCVSTGTIDTHRNKIRNKLGINREKINLRAYLLSLT